MDTTTKFTQSLVNEIMEHEGEGRIHDGLALCLKAHAGAMVVDCKTYMEFTKPILEALAEITSRHNENYELSTRLEYGGEDCERLYVNSYCDNLMKVMRAFSDALCAALTAWSNAIGEALFTPCNETSDALAVEMNFIQVNA